MKNLLPIFILCFNCANAELSVTTSQRGVSGTDIYIHNDTSLHVTAFVATWIIPHSTSTGHASSYTFRDALIEDNFTPINPGEQQTLTVGGRGAIAEQALLQGALFEDGSTFGDPAWVNILLARRSHYLQALKLGLADLHGGSAQGATFNSLIQTLQTSETTQIGAIKSNSPTSPYLQQLFNETTPAMKEANLQVVAQNVWQSCVRAVFGPLIHGFTKAASKQGTSQAYFTKMVADLTNLLTQKQNNLLASKPSLGS